MNERIIYPLDSGGIAVVVPADCGLTIEQIAQKDVPVGVPYLIVEDSEIPSDMSTIGLWTADFSNPDGYGGRV